MKIHGFEKSSKKKPNGNRYMLCTYIYFRGQKEMNVDHDSPALTTGPSYMVIIQCRFK